MNVKANAHEAKPALRCVHEAFEEQARLTPRALAVDSGTRQFTYAELNSRADQLAHYLRKQGVQPEMRIAICLERSLEIAVAVLGVLKAGGAYVPIDPAYPAERLKFLVADAQSTMMLTSESVLPGLTDLRLPVLCLERDWETISSERASRTTVYSSPEHLAYIAYTSGSTGRPKGVMVEHRALTRYAEVFAERVRLGYRDRVLQFASLGFDVFAEELFPALLSGATVVLTDPDPKMLSPADFSKLLAQYRITWVELPTGFWHFWTEDMIRGGYRPYSGLRLVVIGGEKASQTLLREWQLFGIPVANVYGLTEATITSTVCDLYRGFPQVDARPGSCK